MPFGSAFWLRQELLHMKKKKKEKKNTIKTSKERKEMLKRACFAIVPRMSW
jgi:hypothetical protein